MRGAVRSRWRIGAAAVLAVALIWGLSAWWHEAHRSALIKALEHVPGDGDRYSWTSWSGVTDVVGTKGGTAGILSRAFDADLDSTSAFVTSAPAFDKLGLPLRELGWELYAQSDEGAVEVLHSGAAERWMARLKKTGWARSAGVYDGSSVVSDLGISPEFTYLTRRGDLIIASENADYLRAVADHDVKQAPKPIRSVASALSSPVSAVVFSGDYTCGHLAMSQADDIDQQQAQVLLEAAGEVDPMSAFAMGYAPDAHHLRVAMTFDNDDIAKQNADSRAELAAGDAPGQGGRFTDRFRLGKVEADGARLILNLTPRRGQSALSDLSSGPVLFASC